MTLVDLDSHSFSPYLDATRALSKGDVKPALTNSAIAAYQQGGRLYYAQLMGRKV